MICASSYPLLTQREPLSAEEDTNMQPDSSPGQGPLPKNKGLAAGTAPTLFARREAEPGAAEDTAEPPLALVLWPWAFRG